MLFRPAKPDGYGSLAELVRELKRSLASADSEVQRGLLQGLTAIDAPAPLSSGTGEMSDRYRGGVLAGRLYRHLIEARGRMDGTTMIAASIHGANMAQAAVQGRFDAPSADVVLEEHLVASVRAARQGNELDEESEREALRWLADELGCGPTGRAGPPRSCLQIPLSEASPIYRARRLVKPRPPKRLRATVEEECAAR